MLMTPSPFFSKGSLLASDVDGPAAVDGKFARKITGQQQGEALSLAFMAAVEGIQHLDHGAGAASDIACSPLFQQLGGGTGAGPAIDQENQSHQKEGEQAQLEAYAQISHIEEFIHHRLSFSCWRSCAAAPLCAARSGAAQGRRRGANVALPDGRQSDVITA
ncbi:hypothetical protein [Collimonas sp.]|uniref:hypothetical protein n=1 Tax=Collimonas sp. TaxID=1963772 RepID=UPI002C6C29EC|nr:hypothetical protein [Collimonas sp.]HWX01698.1 hypothetical protein [Collimonas sp.]